MVDHTRLAVVSLNPNTRFIRVYYQHEARIQELCFDPKNGWHAKKNHIVAMGAKRNSPIAAIARYSGNETRVYFLDTEDQIIERVRSSSSPDGPSEWKDDPNFLKRTVPTGSQLAAAFSGGKSENIHIFYQDDDSAIQELKYTGEEEWGCLQVAPTAQWESSLVVVSMGDSDLRLYYQHQNGKIQEQYTNADEWTNPRELAFLIPPKAPISAVAWKSPFNIRLYSVSTDNELLMMTYTKKKWLIGPSSAGKITGSLMPASISPVAVAAVWIPYDKAVRVFYPYQLGHIGESIIFENRTIDFSTKPGSSDSASQAEVTPLSVYITHEAKPLKCQDKQAQESGIWPEESGLVADSAKQNKVIEELGEKVKGLQGQIATLQAERLVDGGDVRYWKGQNDYWKRNYDSMSSSYNGFNGMSNRHNELCQMIQNSRTSAYHTADNGVTGRQWTISSGASGYLKESDRQWAISAIMNAALADVSFDSTGKWVVTYRSLP